MYIIDKLNNSIHALNRKTFQELGFKERQHLQEWIAGNPDVLGEKLLIIQKEFSDFSETSERLDLLALDKDGNLVIIENKLDDSGRDVTWQALKYASYCSTLTKDQIRSIFQSYLDNTFPGKNAVDVLKEFFDDVDYDELLLNQPMTQRIILVAANFRKEVTSTVLWLMNFKLGIKCFKTIPYELNGQYLLTLDQIIPTKDAQDYVISMTNKTQEAIATEGEVKSSQNLRLRFWTKLLLSIKGKSNLFQNSTPNPGQWLAAGGAGITSVGYILYLTKSDAAVQLEMKRPSQLENKLLFDALLSHKKDIENKFGDKLEWERMDSKKSSKISYYKFGVNYSIEEDWPIIIDFLIEYINKLELAISPHLVEIKNTLKTSLIESQETQ